MRFTLSQAFSPLVSVATAGGIGRADLVARRAVLLILGDGFARCLRLPFITAYDCEQRQEGEAEERMTEHCGVQSLLGCPDACHMHNGRNDRKMQNAVSKICRLRGAESCTR